MRCIWILLLGHIFVGTWSLSHQGQLPNFVLIMVDDLGIGDLGCYGNTTLRTPNIDRLAQDGVKLTQHIVAAPLCTPSRAAFLTGRYAIRSGFASTLYAGVYFFSSSSGGLPRQEVTFAQIAKQQGYATSLIGKWHLGLNCERGDDFCHHPNHYGFDHFYGIPVTNVRDCQPGHGSILKRVFDYVPYGSIGAALMTLVFLRVFGIISSTWKLVLPLALLTTMAVAVFVFMVFTYPYFNCILMRNLEIVEQPYSSENLTQKMTYEAVKFLQRNSERSFLLFFSFIQVHTALFASQAFHGKSQHGLYGDAVEEVDWSVGKLMETLDMLGLRENTLVYLTSDHGAHLEEVSVHGEMHGGWNGIFRAGKSTNWEGGIRVPGILRWNSVLPGNKSIHEPTSTMDIFPTVAKLAGADIPKDRYIDGHDLMPLLLGEVDRSEHEFLFHYCNSFLNAVRWHPLNSNSIWKVFFFTPNLSPANSTTCMHTHVCMCLKGYVTYHNPPLLFDLSRDPSESTPLTPQEEPNFHMILATIEQEVIRHTQTLTPMPNQLSLGNLLWKPWLQPCCSTLSQLCTCNRDNLTS
ncbi:hypothetical protein AGOR_G00060730 [Albula goreensis]|uniref:Sulfatase N-terminal domain-containing protein n=1 Tax=Albula goreensis TaxID=1534307 RepID=A0A8T3DYG4_9TELE|nr:hypothetical protein AGOR_G00060730 [Albula goreensis]